MERISKIAIGQLCSSSNLSRNFEIVKRLIVKAIENDVRVIFFPEATDYLSQNASHSRRLVNESPRFVANLRAEIKRVSDDTSKRIDVAIGVHLPPTGLEIEKGETRVKNVLLYINHKGDIVQSYQKLHLFDVDVPNGPILKESSSVQPGSKIPEIVDTPVGKLGMGICYDIRFPEQSLELRSKGAEILCFPSAFTMKTGEAHWELLGKSRAIDTQCFVVMPAQSGEHDVYADGQTPASGQNAQRISWGHSMVIDPWGRIIAQSTSDDSGEGAELITAELDYTVLDTVRANMPLLAQRMATDKMIQRHE